MKRKLNVLQLRRLKDGGLEHEIRHDEAPTKKRASAASSKRAKSASRNQGGLARQEDPRENQNLSAEEIALMFMEVAENINRCFDFDLQKWLNRYENLRGKDINFPEVAMIIMSAAQIYGRKVDYLEDIVLHMEQDQKGRDESGEKGDKPAATSGRKRATRFQPQSLSDCFSDLEFTFIDQKTAPMDSLVSKVQRVDVDRRNKFQQMQELCNELRMMPTKQRRQEILNRLRDEANIPPIMSSHTAARKNQILDLESGETIGTRYDFQIHVNFIDVRTGSLVPEHDLKRFFQRCDVIDYLFEQQECDRLVREQNAPAVLPLKPREFKMYMPPEYLKDKYRIQMNDTSDFDNELYQARNSNYQEDPMLKLMGSSCAGGKKDSQKQIEAVKAVETLETSCTEDASFANVSSSSVIDHSTDASVNTSELLNSSQELMDTSQETSTFDSSQKSSSSGFDSEDVSSEDITRASKEHSPEPELMALENQLAGASSGCGSEPTHSSCQSRLSMVDEGIGADRDSKAYSSSPLSFTRTSSMDKLSDCVSLPKSPKPPVQFFGGGTVIGVRVVKMSLKTLSLKPALLNLNVLRIPECHLRKHLLFTLPAEYKRRKMDLVRRTSDRNKDIYSLAVYSLHPQASKRTEWQERPTTPEPEDFHGFDECADILTRPYGKCLYSLAPPSERRCSRASSPGSDFFGFENDTPPATNPSSELGRDEIAHEEPKTAEDSIQSEDEANHEECEQVVEPKEAPQQCEPTSSGSQQSTPTRTLSRDSGISDDQTERRESRSKENTPEPSSAPQEIATSEPSDEQISGNNVTTSPGSAKYIQSVAEAKELIEKVNNWHRKLKPILIQSERRNHFDIHAYGTEIIDSFGVKADGSVLPAPPISFAQIMDNKQQDYTARYFLSMLMLANTNNVQIVAKNQSPSRLSGTEDIELRLLSRKRHHKEMESMGEKIPCDNTPSGEGVKTKTSRAKKRKRLVEDDQRLKGETRCEIDGIQRLQENGAPDHDFLDKIRSIYPDINSEETVRKRIAFRRGMRRCAYGLSEDERAVEVQVALGEPPPPMVSEPHRVQRHEENDLDEVLSVNLLTNETMVVPIAVDPDPCCSKSVYSVAESGYESMLGSIADC